MVPLLPHVQAQPSPSSQRDASHPYPLSQGPRRVKVEKSLMALTPKGTHSFTQSLLCAKGY